VRGLVAERLTAGLAYDQTAGRTWRIVDHEAPVTRINPGETVVQVVRTRVRPGERLDRSMSSTLWVRLLTGVTDPDLADDELDDRLGVLLAYLDTDPLLRWEEAERGVFADTFPSYVVTVTTDHL